MRILVTGASGQVGAYLLRAVQQASLPTVAWSGSHGGESFGHQLIPVNLADPDATAVAFRAAKPSVVIHAAAIAGLAQCVHCPEAAWAVNVRATRTLVELASEASASLVLLSSDWVFDGERSWYREDDEPFPLSLYGRTKVAAEQAVLDSPHGVVVRLSLLYGPGIGGRRSFFDEQVATLRQRRHFALFEDEWRTPLDLVTAAQAILDLMRTDFRGILHLGGPERLSRLEMGCRLAIALGADPTTFVPTSRASAGTSEPRPRDVSLNSSRWLRITRSPVRSFDESLTSLLQLTSG